MKIEVPTSWEVVTVRQWQAIQALFKESAVKGEGLEGGKKDVHDYNTECALISILTGEDMDDILSLHRSAHNSIMNNLAFLSQPIEGKLKTRIKINGRRYKFEKVARNINGGQWLTLMHFLQDEEKIDENLHNLIACYAYRYKWFSAKYNGKIHEEVARDMLDLPITVVKPLTDFFLSDWLRYATRILRFSEIAARGIKRLAERQLTRSNQNTVG